MYFDSDDDDSYCSEEEESLSESEESFNNESEEDFGYVFQTRKKDPPPSDCASQSEYDSSNEYEDNQNENESGQLNPDVSQF